MPRSALCHSSSIHEQPSCPLSLARPKARHRPNVLRILRAPSPPQPLPPTHLTSASLLPASTVVRTTQPMLTLSQQHVPHLSSFHNLHQHSRHARRTESPSARERRPRPSPYSRAAALDHGSSTNYPSSQGVKGAAPFRGLNMNTYYGQIRTPADAIILFEACRLGMLPRVQRRLSEKERQSIRPGSGFVWDEREAGMRRWTDGKSWSASRVCGSFLTYREMEGKRGGGGSCHTAPTPRNRIGESPNSGRGSDSDIDMAEEAPDGYRYKPDGLMKQSFSITTSTGQHLHLISYYSRTASAFWPTDLPSNDPNLRHIRPVKGMYPESTIQEQPNVPSLHRENTLTYANTAPHETTLIAPPAYTQTGVTPPSTFPGHSGYNWSASQASTGSQHRSPAPYAPLPLQLSVPGNTSGRRSLPHFTRHLSSPDRSSSASFDRSSALSIFDGSLPPPSMGHRLLTAPTSGARLPSYVPNVPPQSAFATPAAQQRSNSISSSVISMAPIDPRLTAISPRSGAKSLSSVESVSSDHFRVQFCADGEVIPGGVATSIPGIGSLIKVTGVDSPGALSDRSGSRAGSRGGSRSPGGTPRKMGPHGILSEDVRALRVLDRAFSA